MAAAAAAAATAAAVVVVVVAAAAATVVRSEPIRPDWFQEIQLNYTIVSSTKVLLRPQGSKAKSPTASLRVSLL